MLHVCVATSSVRDHPREPPAPTSATKTLPSGCRKAAGYQPTCSGAPPSAVQVLVPGSKTSGYTAFGSVSVLPPITTTRPSARVTALGYHRAWFMFAMRVHD